MSLKVYPPRRLARDRRRRARAITAMLLAGLVVASGVSSTALMSASSPAQAIEFGPGISTADSGFVGSYWHADGSQVYCIELGRVALMGNNPTMSTVTSLPAFATMSFGPWSGGAMMEVSAPGFSGTGLGYMNYVMGKWGSTADSTQAAAVQLAIWKLRAAGSSAGYQQYLAWYGAQAPAADALADSMIAEAQAQHGAATAPADPRIWVNTPYQGVVEADPGTTSLTIENGIFTATGTSTITFDPALSATAQVPFQGRPPLVDGAWDRYYRVTVTGTYRYVVAGDNVAYGNPGTSPLDQGVTHAGDFEVREGSYSAVYLDPDTLWSPVLSTQVPSVFVPEGQRFGDTVTFDVAASSATWRVGYTTSGEPRFAPITATGILYGPFLSDPALNPQATPPVGAPVAARATVTTSTSQGPGSYPVVSDEVSSEPGYYTWVWDIAWEDQLGSVQAPVNGDPSIPEHYFFTDGFGQATEGQITPSNVRFTTELSATQVTIGDSFTDAISVYLVSGGWLQDSAGGRTAFTLRGTVYGLDEEPVQQASAPEDTEVLSTTFLTVNAPGQTFESDPIQVPVATGATWLTVQWCLLDADQTEAAAGKAAQWCDDFGVPAESARVLRPEVTTQAQSEAAVLGTMRDTAIVDGAVPNPDVATTEVDFTAYLKPVAGEPKHDETWELILDDTGDPVLWTADEAADPAAVCEAQPVGRTERVPVTGTGMVVSPELEARTAGTVYWVEELFITPEGGQEFSAHRGACGLPNETTAVVEPTVTTKATREAVVGEEISDTAIVSGPLAVRDEVRYEVTFEAYHRAEGTTTAPDETLCTPGTRVWESSEATPVTAAGEYRSESWRTGAEHVGEILWVETLWRTVETDEGEIRTEVHRGRCGQVDEITQVTPPVPPVLSVTGAGFPLLLLGGVAGVLLFGGAVLMVVRRRRASLGGEEVANQ